MRRRCTASRRAAPGPRGCRWLRAMGLVSDAVVSAGRRWRSAGRDEARLRPHDARGPRLVRCAIRASSSAGWRGPVLDAGVHRPSLRPGSATGRRTLADLCGHYGIDMRPPARRGGRRRRLDRGAPGTGVTPRGAVAVRPDPAPRGPDPLAPGLDHPCDGRLSPGEACRWIRGTTCGRWHRRSCRQRPEGGRRSALDLQQVPDHVDALVLGRTTLAGCCLSMWPMRPL